MKNAELAHKIYEAFCEADPYDMPEYEETEDATLEMLSTVEGCHDIINQLLELVNDLVK